MVFSNIVFIYVFLPIVIIGYFLVRTELKNLFLLLSSLFFYAWGEPLYILIMIFSIVINYVLAILINKFDKNYTYKKTALTLSILINISILLYYKYIGFILSNLGEIFNITISYSSPALPIGISFYTFQSISYLVDVYRKESEPQKNIIHLALYISFFPQLVAGPIVRYESIAAQLKERKADITLIAQGSIQFIIGLSKKVLIANQLALVADEIFSKSPDTISTSLSWIGLTAYTLQIFFDFSGYSDMAIGLGRIFGFQFPINFNYPYISKNITEFWRRWHITLGSWFRDYVYIPLGGSRKGTWVYLRNLFVVWFLTGIWHGASWNFIVWGIYFGVIIAVEKFVLGNLLKKTWLPFQHIYAILLIMIGWVFFRADN
ncbi:alginate O-acetyltransferase AlgI, partial [Paenibacillus sp. oral taxon 786 str. D14]|uniref:MBOAT family O-acyltransferase n=1 Tax=Paenibacillus sp. oral taxon 786 TaxID=652715 RepID=UPI0001AFD865